jgi:hypothetical protein
MKKMRPLKYLIVTASAGALSACASWLGGDEIKVRPFNNISSLSSESRDPLYESAATAIDQRDYGRALDYLQEAKARNPSNIKVLNALGVIYDKLGRFDLSARYYDQARAIDPNSRIVAANLDYSRTLQGLSPLDRGPVARMDLPENFNTGPARNPTVLASKPVAGDTAKSSAVVAASPEEILTISPHTEVAGVVKQSPQPAAPMAIPVRQLQGMDSSTPQSTAPLKLEKVRVTNPVAANVAGQSVEKPAIVAAPNSVAPARSKAESPMNEVPRVAVAIPPTPQMSMPGQQTRIVERLALPSQARSQSRRIAALPASKKVLTIGQPVRILNASGKPDRVGIVSRRLSTLGWTVRLTDAGRIQPNSTLVYNPRNAGAAKAMERTLPFPIRLVADSGASGMRLLVGRDYLLWKSKNARLQTLWQKDSAIASLQTTVVKGVR